jgi:hypothetical protein
MTATIIEGLSERNHRRPGLGSGGGAEPVDESRLSATRVKAPSSNEVMLLLIRSLHDR